MMSATLSAVRRAWRSRRAQHAESRISRAGNPTMIVRKDPGSREDTRALLIGRQGDAAEPGFYRGFNPAQEVPRTCVL